MLLLGHRGAPRHARENTLAAFEAALAHGCNGFEFDVRLTADRRLAICHDSTQAGVTIASSTYAAVAPRMAPQLLELETVLQTFSPRCYLNIELKVAGTEALTCELLRLFPPQHGVLVSSFLPEVLQELRRLDRDLPLGFITKRSEHVRAWRELPVQALVAHHQLVTPALSNEVHAAGCQLFVWTVNDAPTMSRLAALGADALISDDTQLLVETLGPGR